MCPRIALFSSTTNQFPTGGLFSTASFRLSQCREIIEKKTRGKLGVGNYEPNGYWHDWIIDNILLR